MEAKTASRRRRSGKNGRRIEKRRWQCWCRGPCRRRRRDTTEGRSAQPRRGERAGAAKAAENPRRRIAQGGCRCGGGGKVPHVVISGKDAHPAVRAVRVFFFFSCRSSRVGLLLLALFPSPGRIAAFLSIMEAGNGAGRCLRAPRLVPHGCYARLFPHPLLADGLKCVCFCVP